MIRPCVSVCCTVALLLSLCPAAPAQQPPEDLLKSRGLTRVGRTYLLDADVKLPDALRRLLAAKRAADDDTAKRAALEKEIRAADANVSDLYAQLENVSQQKLKRQKAEAYKRNQLGAEQNIIVSRLHEAEKYAAARKAELARMSGEPQDKYAGVVLQLGAEMEATATRYEALAADPQVTAALRALDAKDPAKLALGPSEQFKRELIFVRNQRGKVATGVVKFNYSTGTPQVLATLNDSLTLPMVVDTGASYVSIPWDVAKKLGLNPKAADQTLQLTIANGKTVDAKLMTLKSIRLGQFTAENVTCAVLPAAAGPAPNLLGGTFLRNFVVRIDTAAGELHLTQIAAKPDAPPASVSTASRQPAGPKVEDGFTPLFNGRDLAGWTYGVTDRGEDKAGAGYRVRDGVLYCTRNDGGKLFTEKDYANFVLRFEFKLTDNANNGIGIRTPPTGDPAYVGMEIQVLDNTGGDYKDKAGRPRLRPDQLHGSIYDVVPARPGYLKPVGQWNYQEIRADGRRITVLLNGSVILAADLDKLDNPAVLKKHPGLKNEKGRIGLLGHDSAVEFRNIRIKEL